MTIAELEAARASYRPGQRWEARSPSSYPNWVDLGTGEPGWFYDTDYRQKPDTQQLPG